MKPFTRGGWSVGVGIRLGRSGGRGAFFVLVPRASGPPDTRTDDLGRGPRATSRDSKVLRGVHSWTVSCRCAVPVRGGPDRPSRDPHQGTMETPPFSHCCPKDRLRLGIQLHGPEVDNKTDGGRGRRHTNDLGGRKWQPGPLKGHFLCSLSLSTGRIRLNTTRLSYGL